MDSEVPRVIRRHYERAKAKAPADLYATGAKVASLLDLEDLVRDLALTLPSTERQQFHMQALGHLDAYLGAIDKDQQVHAYTVDSPGVVVCQHRYASGARCLNLRGHPVHQIPAPLAPRKTEPLTSRERELVLQSIAARMTWPDSVGAALAAAYEKIHGGAQ